MSIPIPEIIKEAAELFAKVPASLWPDILEFARALVDGDAEKAKRAATNAATKRIFSAPVKRPTPGTGE